jgi:hypothetical protein
VPKSSGYEFSMFFPKSRGLLNGLRPRIWEPVSSQDGTIGYKATSRAMLSLKRILTHTDTKYVWTKLLHFKKWPLRVQWSNYQQVNYKGQEEEMSAIRVRECRQMMFFTLMTDRLMTSHK